MIEKRGKKAQGGSDNKTEAAESTPAASAQDGFEPGKAVPTQKRDDLRQNWTGVLGKGARDEGRLLGDYSSPSEQSSPNQWEEESPGIRRDVIRQAELGLKASPEAALERPRTVQRLAKEQLVRKPGKPSAPVPGAARTAPQDPGEVASDQSKSDR